MKVLDASGRNHEKYNESYVAAKSQDAIVFAIIPKRKYAYVKWDTFCSNYDLTETAMDKIRDLWIALSKSWRRGKVFKNEIWLFNWDNCGSFEILIADIPLVKPSMLSILEKDENYIDIRDRHKNHIAPDKNKVNAR